MITLLTGENSFELKRALDDIALAFDGHAEKIDGSDLELSRLPELLSGMTLFADKRLVIITHLSENKMIWDVFPDWVPKIEDDIHVVLVEQKPDKRTRTFKELKKGANVHEFSMWSDRDSLAAESWVVSEAKRQGFTLDRKSAQVLVNRIGHDQWALYHALQKLAVLDEVSPEVIETIIEATPSENVFNLLDAALRGDVRRIAMMIQSLQRSQDPYMTFGLLSGQVFQLAALAVSEKSSGEVAGDIGAHPYALSKLSPHAKRVGRSGARKMIAIFAEADTAMKSSSVNPWLLIERALIKTASV